MKILALLAIGTGIALFIASAFVEEFLPGGRWNAYRASNVFRNHVVYRIAAHLLLLFVAFALLVLGSWLWRHAG